MRKIQLSKRVKILLASTFFVGAVATISLVLYNRYSTSDTNIVKTDDYGGIINYGPPTEEEKNAGDKQKEIIGNQETNQQSSTSQKKSVAVIITDAGQYDDTIEVRAFIPNHYQDGTCEITFRQGDLAVSKTAPAYRDISTTICTNPLVKRSEFPSAGKWQVTVTYNSKNANGASEVRQINLQ